MADARGTHWPYVEAVTMLQTHIASLDERLQAAERAVHSARTPHEGATAHRAADDLLIQLEAAEQELQQLLATPVKTRAVTTRHRRPSTLSAQPSLFDVG